MKQHFISALIFLNMLCLNYDLSSATNASQISVRDSLSNSMDRVINQYKSMIKNLPGYNSYPTSIDKNTRELKTKDRTAWEAGFFPGSLWYLFEHTGDNFWRDNAILWTENLEENSTNTNLGDIGFIMFNSYGNAFRLTENKEYLSVIEKSAGTLLTHYSENVECIHSNWWWGKWNYPVIIDYMMNLELLFWTGQYTGNQEMTKKAINHANKTITNHFRKDYSTYHLVDYNNIGEIISKETFQGYSKNSTWARGQAWAIYGYTMAYRYTKRHEFLFQAECAANYFLNKLPDDLIPYWDFNAPEIPDEPKDASAAAIVASALIELAEYSENNEFYIDKAEKILLTLASDEYQFSGSGNAYFIIDHCTGYKKNGGFDQPLIYADYYYIEALLRYLKLTSPISNTQDILLVQHEEPVRLFPNPVTDILNVQYSKNPGETISIKIYNNLGQLLQIKTLNATTDETYTINMRNLDLNSGVHYISIYSDNERIVTKKIVYEK